MARLQKRIENRDPYLVEIAILGILCEKADHLTAGGMNRLFYRIGNQKTFPFPLIFPFDDARHLAAHQFPKKMKRLGARTENLGRKEGKPEPFGKPRNVDHPRLFPVDRKFQDPVCLVLFRQRNGTAHRQVAIPGKKRLADIMPREVFDRIDETKYKQGTCLIRTFPAKQTKTGRKIVPLHTLILFHSPSPAQVSFPCARLDDCRGEPGKRRSMQPQRERRQGKETLPPRIGKRGKDSRKLVGTEKVFE